MTYFVLYQIRFILVQSKWERGRCFFPNLEHVYQRQHQLSQDLNMDLAECDPVSSLHFGHKSDKGNPRM